MKDVLLVGIGGALGAIARFGLGLAIVRAVGTGFPWPTLLINVSGCLLIGLAMGLEPSGVLTRDVRLVAVIGFLGAFTTFSTFGYETLSLAQGGKVGFAFLYVLSSVFLGLASVTLGYVAMRSWGSP